MFKHRLLIVVRWIAFAPLAVAAAALARLALIALNRWAMSQHIDPDSLLGNTWILFISTVCYTGVLVYVSAYVVPCGKKAVSIIVATLATAVAVALCAMSAWARDIESVFYSVCFALGAIVTSFSIVSGQTELPSELAWNDLPDCNRDASDDPPQELLGDDTENV